MVMERPLLSIYLKNIFSLLHTVTVTSKMTSFCPACMYGFREKSVIEQCY